MFPSQQRSLQCPPATAGSTGSGRRDTLPSSNALPSSALLAAGSSAMNIFALNDNSRPSYMANTLPLVEALRDVSPEEKVDYLYAYGIARA